MGGRTYAERSLAAHLDRLRREIFVRTHRGQVPDAVQVCTLFVVGVHHILGRPLDVRVLERLVLRPRVVYPSRASFEVHRAELPSPGRSLIRAWNRRSYSPSLTDKPILDQQDAGAHEHALELRTGMHELYVLLFRTQAMTHSTPARLYLLRAEEHDFAGGGQMRNVPLEVPLRFSSSVGAASATTRHIRGFRGSGMRLILPPLPRRRVLPITQPYSVARASPISGAIPVRPAAVVVPSHRLRPRRGLPYLGPSLIRSPAGPPGFRTSRLRVPVAPGSRSCSLRYLFG